MVLERLVFLFYYLNLYINNLVDTHSQQQRCIYAFYYTHAFPDALNYYFLNNLK